MSTTHPFTVHRTGLDAYGSDLRRSMRALPNGQYQVTVTRAWWDRNGDPADYKSTTHLFDELAAAMQFTSTGRFE